MNAIPQRIIGEDKSLSIKVGVYAGNPSTEDVILVRGPGNDVDRAVKEILQIIENAKNDEIVNSYVSLFDHERFNNNFDCFAFVVYRV